MASWTGRVNDVYSPRASCLLFGVSTYSTLIFVARLFSLRLSFLDDFFFFLSSLASESRLCDLRDSLSLTELYEEASTAVYPSLAGSEQKNWDFLTLGSSAPFCSSSATWSLFDFLIVALFELCLDFLLIAAWSGSSIDGGFYLVGCMTCVSVYCLLS